MVTTPSGAFSLPLKYLALTIAGSSTFRTAVGAANPTAALSSIHYFSVDNANITRPMAVIGWDSAYTLDSEYGGTRNFFDLSGSLFMIYQQAVTGSTEADSVFNFTNVIGAITSEMCVLAGQAGYLDIVNMSLMEGPIRPSDEERQTNSDYFHIVFNISYRGVAE